MNTPLEQISDAALEDLTNHEAAVIIAKARFGAYEIETATLTQQGGGRRSNSDALLCRPGAGLFAVADGVSTLPGAAETSRRCLTYLTLALEGNPDAAPDRVANAIKLINGRLFAESRSQRKTDAPRSNTRPNTGPGTESTELGACTLAGILLSPEDDGAFSVFHVGDAEVWLNAGNEAARVTDPQSVLRPSTRHPGKMVSRLAAAMGAKPLVKPVVQEFTIDRPGGAVICTDGIDGTAELIRNPWFTGVGPDNAFEDCLNACIAHGQTDDASLVALRWRPL